MKPSKWLIDREALQQCMLPVAALSVFLAAPTAIAQSSSEAQLEEIIVSARRQQESAQEIPISITVVDQETMINSNVFSSVDLKQFTPSLAVNTRFGPDQASFAIRGFTQELRTTASVGFYFAEVVAPRGGGSITAGDGAGPGAFFDLQNVLVLKGPQGTLFGRNTTGGAIMLTPQEPTNQLEGYLEGSAGNYDMQRIQGVINVPVGDTVRTRFGIDTMQRDGYLSNKSGHGPSELGNTDYVAARASVIWEVTDTVENYTILSYTSSENNGIASSLFACKPGLALFNMGCAQQLAHQGDDFYSLESLMKNPTSELKQWQAINTTTFEINNDLTIKNILSYADLDQTNRTAVYGINYEYLGIGNVAFAESGQAPGLPSNAQVSIVEELQFQGYAMDGDLTWQAGLYYENSRPDGMSGSQGSGQLLCTSTDQNNPENSNCVDVVRNYYLQTFGADLIGTLFGPGGYGAIGNSIGEVEYINQAAYSEMTYQIDDQWRLTGGLRYTKDKAEGSAISQTWNGFPYQGVPPTPGPSTATRCTYTTSSLAGGCKDGLEQTSEAVTGLLGVDYFLTQDVMLYGKYSRGYRMGSVNIFGGEGFRTFDPEHVDSYEIGAKTTFGGPVPGTLNAAVFYNDLQDQQLQYGYVAAGLAPTTAIVNAGSSTIQGLELESTLMLLSDLSLNISYTYLDTELKEMMEVTAADPTVQIVPTTQPNGDLTYSPQHSVVASLNYQLPLPVEVGAVAFGVTYSYTGEQNSTSPEYINSSGRLAGSPYATLDAYEVVNANVNWNGIFGSQFDASLFATNLLDEEYTTYVSGLYHSLGFETRMTGVPRMWGARLRYNFGK